MIGAVALLFAAVGMRSTPLHISGTKIVGADGKEIRFHGINVCSLEWSVAGEHVETSIPTALDKWGANLVRVPLSQDRWFGKSPDSKDNGARYQRIVDGVVAQVATRGKHILLDLHWSDCNEWGRNIGQHALPDNGSLKFWKDCAKRYANNPAVIFDLYNEPIEAPWDVWRNGGQVTETFQDKKFTYQAVGLQTLLEAIRGVGAKNLILAGGLGYSSRLDGILTHRLVDKSGQGVVYANHFYPGWEGVDSWEKRIVAVEKKLPLIIGEFGGDPKSLPLDFPKRRVAQVLAVLKKHDWNWCAWCMHPAASPCLIKDWTYAPTEYFGALVLKALRGQSVPIPPRETTESDKSVYDDKLEHEFQSWSSAKVNMDATTAHSGSHSIQVDAQSGQQLQLGTIPFDGQPYKAISLWMNGGTTGGQKLVLSANVMDTAQKSVPIPTLTPGKWTHIVVSFSSLGIATKDAVKSFTLRAANGGSTSTYYVDDIVIQGKR